MNLPKIDLSSLPELDTVTGLFGSLSASEGPTFDDCADAGEGSC